MCAIDKAILLIKARISFLRNNYGYTHDNDNSVLIFSERISECKRALGVLRRIKRTYIMEKIGTIHNKRGTARKPRPKSAKRRLRTA
jgi:hypothetical protein